MHLYREMEMSGVTPASVGKRTGDTRKMHEDKAGLGGGDRPLSESDADNPRRKRSFLEGVVIGSAAVSCVAVSMPVTLATIGAVVAMFPESVEAQAPPPTNPPTSPPNITLPPPTPPPTDPPPTMAPTTAPPPTMAPTIAPTRPPTMILTTAPPPTMAPTTAPPPPTMAPTTAPPPTMAPTTAPPPPTMAPTTAPPPTMAPTTAPPPPTMAPTTAPPPPTMAPTTAPPPPTMASPETNGRTFLERFGLAMGERVIGRVLKRRGTPPTESRMEGVDGGPTGLEVGSEGEWSRFDRREGKAELEGSVTSFVLDASRAHDDRVIGATLALGRGIGRYMDRGMSGDIEADLLAFAPYARLSLADHATVWGTVGYGRGNLALNPNGRQEIEADFDYYLAAAGMRGVLAGTGAAVAAAAASAVPEGSEGRLEAIADLVWTRTDSTMPAAATEDTRMRLGLEGTWAIQRETGGSLYMSSQLLVAVHPDADESPGGSSVEIGAGVGGNVRRGLGFEVAGRAVVGHDSRDFRDRELTASLTYDAYPAVERGFSARIGRAVGKSPPGVAGNAGRIGVELKWKW